MANERLSGFLGLARKAGKLVFGFDMTVESIQKGTAKAVLLSSDCAERTARNIKRIAEEKGHFPVKISHRFEHDTKHHQSLRNGRTRTWN